ncbi:ATP-binding protein [Niabella sp. CC-SYL272]|uniref:AAA family ATPase n=1 Tax=Niabella agricola TaxID=2891571 RepID=UPI001F327601|nr:ATP-binding protein [Niabella agricola]MCF3108504.1 ATP-binding protein [Niabella agricola]
MGAIVGRTEELQVLSDIKKTPEAELVAVHGRRRVGKTYLVRSIFEKEIVFEISGLHNASLQEQLEHFKDCLSKTARKKKLPIPETWLQAFQQLIRALPPGTAKSKKVVFFDEFPWLDSPRSGFMPAFENFWNSWACRQKNLIVIICGSAASWMIRKIVNNSGALHNRLTRQIRLLPFSLAETEQFFRAQAIKLDRYQVLQLYMAMGGVPQYLKQVKRGESAVQAIDRICFTRGGYLSNEFSNLYCSLFDSAQPHIRIVKALAQKPSGLTRNAIIDMLRLSSGGGITQILDELTESGFIKSYIPFGKTVKNSIYKLTDEYSLFYLKFIAPNKYSGKSTWIKLFNTSSWKSWSSYAFEAICQKHLEQLKAALGISGIHTRESIWRAAAPTPARQDAQIDLVIDRNDRCINLFEMKFSSSQFVISKSYRTTLFNKRELFIETTGTKKTVFTGFMTTFGVKNADDYAGLIQHQLTMDILFRPAESSV